MHIGFWKRKAQNKFKIFTKFSGNLCFLFSQPNGTDLFNFIHGCESWPFYLGKMSQRGTWGDNVILQAAANKYNTPICVVSSLQDHDDIIISPDPPPPCHSTDALVVGHIHEAHYVSLQPIEGRVYMTVNII